MDKKILTLSAILAAAGAGSLLIDDSGEVKQVQVQTVVEPDALMDAAPTCAEEARAAGPCSRCKTLLWDKPTEGWCCGGAFMPTRVQTCLDAAAKTLPTPEPVEELEALPK